LKRFWIAIAILILIFAATVGNTFYLGRLTTELSGLLTQAEQSAEQGNWDQAQQITEQARARWNSHSPYLHIVLHHADIDQIETCFGEALELIHRREDGEYSAANVRLITQIGLLYESECFSLANIL